MNHRKGGLTRKDFDESQWQQPRSFFTSPIEHSSDFGQLSPGRTFHKPSRIQAPQPSKRTLRETLGDAAFAIVFGTVCALIFYAMLWRRS